LNFGELPACAESSQNRWTPQKDNAFNGARFYGVPDAEEPSSFEAGSNKVSKYLKAGVKTIRFTDNEH
jgi:hypothetical protein